MEPNDSNQLDDAEILAKVISLLRQLNPESRQRVIETVVTFFNVRLPLSPSPGTETPQPSNPVQLASSAPSSFSDAQPITAKQFMMEKEPRTDVERIACLAYYLTNYLHTPHFKTLDLSKLNTDAAQPKFSNAAFAADNATKLGYLVPAVKGHKQLSAAGERFVQLLPDRGAAKAAMAAIRLRKRRKSQGRSAEES
jgi:hypothetical protein